MEAQTQTAVTVETLVIAPIEKVWQCWTEPQHITQWCSASDDWHAPYAENDVRENGKFKTTMAAKDGSVSFDFSGVYSKVDHLQLIESVLDDGRKVSVRFLPEGNQTRIKETFETENTNPVEMQRQGWQAILDNFKNYTESAG